MTLGLRTRRFNALRIMTPKVYTGVVGPSDSNSSNHEVSLAIFRISMQLIELKIGDRFPYFPHLPLGSYLTTQITSRFKSNQLFSIMVETLANTQGR